MSLAASIIRDRLGDTVKPDAIDLVIGMIEDRLPPSADVAAVEALVSMARRDWSPLFHPATPPAPAPVSPAAPEGESLTHRVAREARERRASAAAAEPLVNPWAKGSVNITQQVLLTRRDPARAARLRAEAGVQ